MSFFCLKHLSGVSKIKHRKSEDILGLGQRWHLMKSPWPLSSKRTFFRVQLHFANKWPERASTQVCLSWWRECSLFILIFTVAARAFLGHYRPGDNYFGWLRVVLFPLYIWLKYPFVFKDKQILWGQPRAEAAGTYNWACPRSSSTLLWTISFSAHATSASI